MTVVIQDLNKTFLDIVVALKAQPQGAKSSMFNDKNIKGVEGSEKAAQYHSSALKQNNLKSNFELLGLEYHIAPALLAGIGSRESNLGATLQSNTLIRARWYTQNWDGIK